jgi:tetratricopeptide (TPR) repeat protein
MKKSSCTAVILAVLLTLPVFAYAEDTGKQVPSNDSRDWFEKGALCATYGNEKGAVRYFKKVIESDRKRAQAHFNVGISQGEMGEYQRAISSINKAVEANPEKGLYYYGRGRVYLLYGDKNKAVDDFKRAAQLGSGDARDYLQDTVGETWQ